MIQVIFFLIPFFHSMLFKVTKVTHRTCMSEMHITTALPLSLGHIDK